MSVTHGSAGGTETLVATPSSTTIANKGLTAGSNITLSSSSSAVTISYATPYCWVVNSSPSAVLNGANDTLTYNTNINDPTGMHSTVTNKERINILTTGIYAINLILQVTYTGTPTGAAYANIYVVSGGTSVVATNGIAPASTVLINTSCIVPLNSGAYVYTSLNNTSGVTLTPVYALYRSPSLNVCRVGSL